MFNELIEMKYEVDMIYVIQYLNRNTHPDVPELATSLLPSVPDFNTVFSALGDSTPSCHN